MQFVLAHIYYTYKGEEQIIFRTVNDRIALPTGERSLSECQKFASACYV